MKRGTAAERGPALIGLTTSEVRRAARAAQIPQGEEPARYEMALGLTYLQAIEAVGALPVVMPPFGEEAIEHLLDRIDGICLSGGPDLDPAAYGARPHPQLGPTEPELDRFELEMAARADAREIPILAICRGAQALNVARGGTLHQHLPDLSGQIDHRQAEPADQATHPIEIEADSLLARIVGATSIEVNSFHHQGIDRLGEGLRVTARAPDGTIEAVEDPTRSFLIAVQWHAETLVHRDHERRLFHAFARASRGSDRADAELSEERLRT